MKISPATLPSTTQSILKTPNVGSKNTSACHLSATVSHHEAPQPVKYPFKVELVKRGKSI